MASALVDASAMVAAFGLGQRHAQRYHDLLQLASLERWSLSTTWPCVVEAAYLVAPPQRCTLLSWLGAGAIAVFPFAQEALLDLVPLMERYTEAPRSEMDLADASLVWLAGETGVTQVMTLDRRDFSRYRLPDGRAFDVL
ncbi:MAG: PIN domain-containing protein [Proteobacteria bacterium]|nr:PIN domain-containing protein [Pseudomonadota bacterium]